MVVEWCNVKRDENMMKKRDDHKLITDHAKFGIYIYGTWCIDCNCFSQLFHVISYFILMVTEGMITAGAGGSTAGSSSSLPKESDVNINVNPGTSAGTGITVNVHVASGSVVDESVSDIATSSSSKKKTKKKLRLLVVANRLPISVKRKLSENGSGNEYDLVPSSGGLVTALSGMMSKRYLTLVDSL